MQWSCRLRPTGRLSRTAIPSGASSSAGPIPESISSTGDWYEPAERITSRSARIVSRKPFADDLDADRAVALEDDPLDEHAGLDLEVRPLRRGWR